MIALPAIAQVPTATDAQKRIFMVQAATVVAQQQNETARLARDASTLSGENESVLIAKHVTEDLRAGKYVRVSLIGGKDIEVKSAEALGSQVRFVDHENGAFYVRPHMIEYIYAH